MYIIVNSGKKNNNIIYSILCSINYKMQNNNPTANFSPIDKVNYRFKTIYYLINICILLAFVGIIIKMEQTVFDRM